MMSVIGPVQSNYHECSPAELYVILFIMRINCLSFSLPFTENNNFHPYNAYMHVPPPYQRAASTSGGATPGRAGSNALAKKLPP